jgi:2-aminobenzoate-CoA ligase
MHQKTLHQNTSPPLYYEDLLESAHVDTFARNNLPPRDLWPSLADAGYPPRLNAAVELLDRMVERGFGGSVCLRCDDFVWSYADLLARANRIANFLVDKLGLVPGERVLLRDFNTPFLAAVWFAVLKAGGIAVTTMPQLRARELSFIIQKAKIKYAICSQALSDEMQRAQQAASGPDNLMLFDSTDPSQFERQFGDLPRGFANRATSQDDVALIAFTSGTTGQAKGTMHFHRDLLAVCDAFPQNILKPEASDVFCGSPPLGFTFGLGGLLLFPLRVGASALLLPRLTPENLLQSIERHRCTICFTSPTLYRAMTELAPRFDLSSLRKCVSAGEHLPASVFEAWRRATGIRIIDGLGSTEMLHIFVAAREDEIRPGASGKVVPGYQATVLDSTGRRLPTNTVGHLAVRGPTGCRYLDAVEQQRGYVRNGWNITGDAYLVDEDGYFWYHGRTDDMIISAGYNISGVEVEAVLLEHPFVAECAVVGSPDAERGQIVKAFIVLRNSVSPGDANRHELQEYVKAQIAPYKYPREIEFVPALPRTESGKIQRFRLREKEQRDIAEAATS